MDWLEDYTSKPTALRQMIATTFAEFSWAQHADTYAAIQDQGLNDTEGSIRDTFALALASDVVADPNLGLERLTHADISAAARADCIERATHGFERGWVDLLDGDAIAKLLAIAAAVPTLGYGTGQLIVKLAAKDRARVAQWAAFLPEDSRILDSPEIRDAVSKDVVAMEQLFLRAIGATDDAAARKHAIALSGGGVSPELAAALCARIPSLGEAETLELAGLLSQADRGYASWVLEAPDLSEAIHKRALELGQRVSEQTEYLLYSGIMPAVVDLDDQGRRKLTALKESVEAAMASPSSMSHVLERACARIDQYLARMDMDLDSAE
ncbi:hypothetical protein [Leifsonia xyli]|uniref:hypothetical protein n=1 Tax=Leifsonia xyli TaxID=1575 RepID=UPI003D679AD0